MNLTSLSALSTPGTSSTPWPTITSSFFFVVVVLQVQAEVALAHDADLLGRVELLAELGRPRIRWPVSRQVPISGLWSLTAAMMTSAEYQRCSWSAAGRPVRVDADGDLVLLAQLVEAVEAVRVGVGAEVLEAEPLAELEVLAVVVGSS